MALHLITGYAGQEHVTSADQGAYNMGTFGEGEFVLDRGNKFAATIVTNNQITIADGEALMQGRFIKLPVGTTESVTIDNGTSGMKRNDLIVLRYTKNASTGVESVALAVIRGAASAGTSWDPSITTGNITDGTDLVNEMKLYRVRLNGLNIDSIDTLFSTKVNMVEYMDEYQLPVATAEVLGGVKKGSNVNIADDGTLTVVDATNSQKGAMKVGTGLSASSGTVSVKTASTSETGGIKPYSSGGTYIDSQGRLCVNEATSSQKGIVTASTGLEITSSGYIKLKQATDSAIGGVKVNSNYGIELSNGAIRSLASTAIKQADKTLTLPAGWSFQSSLTGSANLGDTFYFTAICYSGTGSTGTPVGYGFVLPSDGALIYNPSTSSKTMKSYMMYGFAKDERYM